MLFKCSLNVPINVLEGFLAGSRRAGVVLLKDVPRVPQERCLERLACSCPWPFTVRHTVRGSTPNFLYNVPWRVLFSLGRPVFLTTVFWPLSRFFWPLSLFFRPPNLIFFWPLSPFCPPPPLFSGPPDRGESKVYAGYRRIFCCRCGAFCFCAAGAGVFFFLLLSCGCAFFFAEGAVGAHFYFGCVHGGAFSFCAVFSVCVTRYFTPRTARKTKIHATGCRQDQGTRTKGPGPSNAQNSGTKQVVSNLRDKHNLRRRECQAPQPYRHQHASATSMGPSLLRRPCIGWPGRKFRRLQLGLWCSALRMFSWFRSPGLTGDSGPTQLNQNRAKVSGPLLAGRG